MITRLALFTSFLWTFGSAQAQVPPPPERDPQALQLLARALSLLLGTQSLPISDAVIQGTLSDTDSPVQNTGTFVAKARGFDLSVEITAGNDSTSYKVLHGFGTTVINGV